MSTLFSMSSTECGIIMIMTSPLQTTCLGRGGTQGVMNFDVDFFSCFMILKALCAAIGITFDIRWGSTPIRLEAVRREITQLRKSTNCIRHRALEYITVKRGSLCKEERESMMCVSAKARQKTLSHRSSVCQVTYQEDSNCQFHGE